MTTATHFKISGRRCTGLKYISLGPMWRLKIGIFRFLALLFSSLDRYLSLPIPRRPTSSITIPRQSRKPGQDLKIYFYTPAGYNQKGKVPFVVNFHGGGYMLGSAKDDARWASFVTDRLDVVFISVEYGLAPEHPFPGAINDGVQVIQWLWKHANEYGLDPSRTVISGSSAGGTLSLAVSIQLHDAMNTSRGPEAEARKLQGKICGIISFYPGVDWTQSRAERTASNPVSASKSPISPSLFDLFDNSYLGPLGERPDMSSPLLSPGRASDKILCEALPEILALYSCE